MTLINYDPQKDVNSKVPVDVIMFGEVVDQIEKGLYVRWRNYCKDNKKYFIPIGPFVNRNILNEKK